MTNIIFLFWSKTKKRLWNLRHLKSDYSLMTTNKQTLFTVQSQRLSVTAQVQSSHRWTQVLHHVPHMVTAEAAPRHVQLLQPDDQNHRPVRTRPIRTWVGQQNHRTHLQQQRSSSPTAAADTLEQLLRFSCSRSGFFIRHLRNQNIIVSRFWPQTGQPFLSAYLMMSSDSCRPSRLRCCRRLQRRRMFCRTPVEMMELDRSSSTSCNELDRTHQNQQITLKSWQPDPTRTACWTHLDPVSCRSSTQARGQRRRRTRVFRTCSRAGPVWVRPSRSTLCHRDSSNLKPGQNQDLNPEITCN